METWQIALEWLDTVGNFMSVAIIPIAVIFISDKLKQNEKKRERAQEEAESKRDAAREEAKKDRERLDKKIDEIYRNVVLNNESSKASLRHMLYRRHAEYMLQGYVTSLQLDEYNRDFKTYEAQGGNGTAKRWHEEVNKLPVDDTKHPQNVYYEIYKKTMDSQEED